MSQSKEQGNFTRIILGIMFFSFLIYLLIAKPAGKYGFNQNDEIEEIQAMDKKNLALNDKATIIPEKFIPVESNTKGVYKYVEQMPKFINCEYMFENEGFLCTKKYILSYAQKFELPEDIILLEDYKIFIKFIVNEKGYINEVSISNTENIEINNLVINHIKKMPKFAKAGFQDGKPVKVEYLIPITIKQNQE